MLDAQLVQDVTFPTGGYPAPYGNRTSSVLHVNQREGSHEEVRGSATLGFAGAGGIAEGPIRRGRGSWVVSARRSFLDLFTDDVGLGGVPVSYTFNGKAVYDLSARDRIWAVNVSGVDEVRLGLADGTDRVRNVTNRRNVSGYSWNRRTNEVQVGEQQGVFPILGFDWRF